MAELTDASGETYSLTPHNRSAGERPQDNNFSTELGEGFGTASFALSRRYDRDYPDLGLLNSFALVGEDGAIAYEGQVASIPRSVQEGHAVQVNAEGWMAHARRRPFTELYADRDLSGWLPMSRARRILLLGVPRQPFDPEVRSDVNSALPALSLVITGPIPASNTGGAEAWYDAGSGLAIGSVYHDWTVNGPDPASANWTWQFFEVSTDDATTSAGSGDLSTASSGSGTYTLTTPQRYVLASLFFGTSGLTAGQQYEWTIRRLAVFGNHGLTKQGTAPDQGYYASDVMANIASRFAPKLNISGITATTYPITHLAFREEITPHEAFKELNRFHLWNLGVWENRTLTFEPFDLSTADWEVRVGEDGVTADLQGDSIESTANGIVVHYRDFAGIEQRITPDDDDELADDDETLPANQHGEQHWTALTVSRPCTEGDAVQMGRAALAEFNRPKRPGTINVPGHIQDSAGHWQQAWKVRAGQTISVTNHPSDAPRLITSTSYNDRSKTVSITVDNAMNRLEAVFARTDRALQAANLG